MILNEDLWHVRLFRFCLKLQDDFFGLNNLQSTMAGRTNLCSYIRTIFMVPLLVALFHLLVLWMAAWAFVIYPLSVTSWDRVLGWYGILTGVVLLILGLGAVKRWVSVMLHKRAAGERYSNLSSTEDFEDSKTSFFALLWIWVKAAKARICPIIDIRE